MTRRGLVLGGGGLTGIAWETGLLFGLAQRGVRLVDAEVLVGTSAGSTVAAQITSSTSIDALYARQLEGGKGEMPRSLGLRGMIAFARAFLLPGDDETMGRRIGASALRAPTVDEPVRRAIVAGRLPEHEWPTRDLRIPAVDAHTGALVVFDRDAGVGLVDAVAASCAVPMVWPPVTIGARRFVDGGVRSSNNADLATGCDIVVVIAPSLVATRKRHRVDEELRRLGAAVRSTVVTPDEETKRAMGRNPLDPAFAPASARAGLEQAARVVDRIARLWG